MKWIDGTPPDMGEKDRVWIVAEIPSLFLEEAYSYKTFVWLKGGGWHDKEVLRTRRWMLIPVN